MAPFTNEYENKHTNSLYYEKKTHNNKLYFKLKDKLCSPVMSLYFYIDSNWWC